jgi:hypothetical protein
MPVWNIGHMRGAMLRLHPSRFGWILAFMLGLWAVVVQAQKYRFIKINYNQRSLL